MCIICAKPSGIDFPSNEYIRNMWEGNSDGAGVMWTSNNKVHIKKGFMEFDDFKRFIAKLKKRYDIKQIPVVMHFRITTHGGTKPENTHPFPVTSKVKNLKALEFCTDLGVAHNGTITIDNPPDISDTMAYISQKMSRIRTRDGAFYKKQAMLDKIEKEITSKMCFLDNRGNLKFIGKFEKEDGIFYSNTSYLGWRRWYSGYYDNYNFGRGYNSKKKINERYYDELWYDDVEYYGAYRSSKTYDDVNPSSSSEVTDISPKTFTSYKRKSLMAVDGYIYNAGELVEGMVFIDENHSAYVLDEVEDVCVKTDGVVYTYSGAYANFKEERAFEMLTKEICSYNRVAL